MPDLYQLRVVLRNVSPLIWRRLLVRSDTSIAQLHVVLQMAMGWSDTHLHRFRIHGKAYGIARCGGIGFAMRSMPSRPVRDSARSISTAGRSTPRCGDWLPTSETRDEVPSRAHVHRR